MPIQETTKMDVREEMAILALDGGLSVREIAERFGVSPPTGSENSTRKRERSFNRADGKVESINLDMTGKDHHGCTTMTLNFEL